MGLQAIVDVEPKVVRDTLKALVSPGDRKLLDIESHAALAVCSSDVRLERVQGTLHHDGDHIHVHLRCGPRETQDGDLVANLSYKIDAWNGRSQGTAEYVRIGTSETYGGQTAAPSQLVAALRGVTKDQLGLNQAMFEV
jgi:hypothetical protein